MDRKYTVEYIPEFADCDRKYDLKAQTLLAWCAELAGNHLRSRGITREQMWSDGQVFLLTRAAICFNKVPYYNTPVLMTTWEAGTKGSQFIRKFCVTDKNGGLLCDIDTMWALVNPHTHKICRPNEYIYEKIPCDEPTKAQVTKFKVENAGRVKDYTFVYSDIDPNGHVNNGTYLRLMSDILPADLCEKHLTALSVNFVHECRQDETVTLYARRENDNFFVCGKFSDDRISFEIAAKF